MNQNFTLIDFNRSYGSFEKILQKRMIMEKTCFEDIVFPNTNTIYKVSGILISLLRRLHSEFGSIPQAFKHILNDDECIYKLNKPGDGYTYHYCWIYDIKSTKHFSNLLKDTDSFNRLVNLYHKLVDYLNIESEKHICNHFLLHGIIFLHWFLTTPGVYFVDNVYSILSSRSLGKEKRTRRWYCIMIPKKPEVIVIDPMENEIYSLEDFLWRFSQEHPQIQYCTRKTIRRPDFIDKINSLHLKDESSSKYILKHIRLMELIQQKKEKTSVQSTSEQDKTIKMDFNQETLATQIKKDENTNSWDDVPDSWDDVPDSWEDF
jgi:hypothetical protein